LRAVSTLVSTHPGFRPQETFPTGSSAARVDAGVLEVT
jgi:hypothetical protein